MPAAIDLTGQIYGRLEVKELVSRGKKRIWKCVCSCGNNLALATERLRSGNTKSCGCLKRDRTIERNYRHGLTKTSEYNSWQSMKQRCLNPNNGDYRHYGGRGIEVCERWSDFKNFLEDMGRKPNAHSTIERIDNAKGYEPSNCIWSTQKAQCNNKRSNHYLEYQCETYTMKELAELTGINYSTLRERINNRKMTPEEAVHSPYGRWPKKDS